MDDTTNLTQVRRKAVMSRALIRTSQRLGLDPQRLSHATGLRPAEIAALESQHIELDPADPRWDAFVNLVRLCWVLDALSAGDEAAMREWMLSYNQDLKAVPADLIGLERGLAHALAYLEAQGPTRH